MNLWTDLKDFFFPRVCLGCGRKLLVHESVVCLSCLSELPFTRLGNTPGNEMERNFWGKFPIERASSLFYYTKGGVVAAILHGMKYHGRREVCRRMGNWLAAELVATGFLKILISCFRFPCMSGVCVSADTTRAGCWQRVLQRKQESRYVRTCCSVPIITGRRPTSPAMNAGRILKICSLLSRRLLRC